MDSQPGKNIFKIRGLSNTLPYCTIIPSRVKWDSHQHFGTNWQNEQQALSNTMLINSQSSCLPFSNDLNNLFSKKNQQKLILKSAVALKY
jgi:hypothetical protein